MTQNKPVIYMDDGSEKALPLKWCICGQCDGEGKSSAYLGAYTWDEMQDAGEEFIEDYFAGNYDRACEHCGGTGKVQVVDHEKIPAADKVIFERQEHSRWCDEQERRMEMLMGA